MKHRITIIALALVAGTALGATAVKLASAFVGAPAGIPVHFSWVNLPPVALTPGVRPPHVPAANIGAFTPSMDQLLNGGTVIKTEEEMKYVWSRLFAVPYDPSQFDFTNTFVVFMGGGAMSMGSFGIGTVEIVNAQYPSFGFGWPGAGTDTDPFLSVTSTTFFPGIMPAEPPPPQFLISAVRIDRALLDDVVFHKNYVYGI